MRVLHVGKFFPPFAVGIEHFMHDLMLAKQALGLEPAAVVHHHQVGEPTQRTTEQGMAVWRVRTLGRAVYAPLSPAFGSVLARAVHDFQPDVIHHHLPNLSAMWALLSPAARRIPWVVHWHSDVVSSENEKRVAMAYRLYRPMERRLLARARAVIATSPTYLDASAPLRAVRDRCHVVPLGISASRLSMPGDSALRTAEATWRPGLLRVLCIGRLTYYKGQSQLLEAMAHAPGAQLVMVGGGDLAQPLAARAAALKLGERVQLIGRLDDEPTRALLVTCDCLCLPSLERTEAFGLVLLEAMHFGRAVIASDIPGSGTGWVVREGVVLPAASEKGMGRRCARSQPRGRVPVDPVAHPAVVGPPQKRGGRVGGVAVVVAVGDADRHARLLGDAQYQAGVLVQVHVHHVIRPLLVQQVAKVAGKPPRPIGSKPGRDACATPPRFVVEVARSVGMEGKVHRHRATLHAAQHMHQPGFDAADVQLAKHVQHANGWECVWGHGSVTSGGCSVTAGAALRHPVRHRSTYA